MVVSSRTPEGWQNHCPVCEQEVCVDPSLETSDAPCPHCGVLLWFVSEFGQRSDAAVLVTVYDDIRSAANSLPTILPDDFSIPAHVVGTVPESVARENHVVPLDEKRNRLVVACCCDPLDLESHDRLRFIMNRPISIVHTHTGWIKRKIEECYAGRGGV